MLNNTYYLVCGRMISRAADEIFFDYSWWKCHTASQLGKDQMDHSTGPILVWFWHFMALHYIAPFRSKGPQGSSRCSRMLTILTTPSWYPCACCNHRCQTRAHQLGIILQSLNRVRDGTSTVYWCIASKLKAPWNFYWMSNMFLWVEIFLYFVCYHVVPKRHSQLDYELNGL